MNTEIVKTSETTKDLEVITLQKRVNELESQLEEAKKLIQKHLLEANEVDVLKMKSADTLTKAKSVIFENTKMIKNQELQIEALNQQVDSLRDVVKITKELLEIRNLEVDQLESKIHCMEERHKAEKERQDLMHKRLEQMIRHNGDLKREYETQLCLFKALRERYDERELAKGVVDSLKSDLKDEKDKRNDQIKQPVQNNQEPNDEKIEQEKADEKEKQEVKEISPKEGDKVSETKVQVENIQTEENQEKVENKVSSDKTENKRNEIPSGSNSTNDSEGTENDEKEITPEKPDIPEIQPNHETNLIQQ